MRLITKIRSKLGLYKYGYEYWVYTNEIVVPQEYLNSRIRKKKWEHKLQYWKDTGEFESPILIDRNFNLIDGYSSVKIAYVNDIDKVPIYFVERKEEEENAE